MIKVFVCGRRATLTQTIEIPTGNVESISCEFEISNDDELWTEGERLAVFSAVTPTGTRKTLPAVIDADGIAQIPGAIISTPNSTVYVGLRATLSDGSVVATNLVDCGKTVFGSGGDNMIETDRDVDESGFNAFIEELRAFYEAALQPLQESIATLINDFSALPTFNDIPTSTSDIVNDSDFVSDTDYVHTDNNFSDETKHGYDLAAEAMHTHENKSTLDEITSEAKAGYDDANAKKHTHANATVLNGLGDSGGSITYNGQAIGGGGGDTMSDTEKAVQLYMMFKNAVEVACVQFAVIGSAEELSDSEFGGMDGILSQKMIGNIDGLYYVFITDGGTLLVTDSANYASAEFTVEGGKAYRIKDTSDFLTAEPSIEEMTKDDIMSALIATTQAI